MNKNYFLKLSENMKSFDFLKIIKFFGAFLTSANASEVFWSPSTTLERKEAEENGWNAVLNPRISLNLTLHFRFPNGIEADVTANPRVDCYRYNEFDLIAEYNGKDASYLPVFNGFGNLQGDEDSMVNYLRELSSYTEEELTGDDESLRYYDEDEDEGWDE